MTVKEAEVQLACLRDSGEYDTMKSLPDHLGSAVQRTIHLGM